MQKKAWKSRILFLKFAILTSEYISSFKRFNEFGE